MAPRGGAASGPGESAWRLRRPLFPSPTRVFGLGTPRTGVRGHREQFGAFCARGFGHSRAADLIGQLADPFYHRKLPALFAEFSEIGMMEKLGCKTAADLGAIFTDFFTLQVEPYIGDAIRYLELTTEGKQWIATSTATSFSPGIARPGSGRSPASCSRPRRAFRW